MPAGSVLIKVAGSDSLTSDFGTPQWGGEIQHIINFTNGTATNQIDRIFFDERTIASGGTDDLDLAGALTSPLGTPFTNAELVMIAVINKPQAEGSANTTNLTIGAGTAPITGYMGGTTPTIGPIRPNGFLVLGSPDAAGLAVVTATSADILRIANSAGAANTYQIAIFGRSA